MTEIKETVFRRQDGGITLVIQLPKLIDVSGRTLKLSDGEFIELKEGAQLCSAEKQVRHIYETEVLDLIRTYEAILEQQRILLEDLRRWKLDESIPFDPDENVEVDLGIIGKAEE